LNILLLTKYGDLGPSSRVRFYQYLPWLEKQGARIQVAPLFGNSYIRALYEGRKYGTVHLLNDILTRIKTMSTRRKYDLIWLENEFLPYIPYFFEKHCFRGNPAVVVNYDDAVFHHYEDHRHQGVRLLAGRKIDRIMANATIVVAGNHYIAEHARFAGACDVEIIPSVIDLRDYPLIPKENNNEKLVVGWIGTPQTVHFLELIHLPLQQFCKESPCELKVMGIHDFQMEGVPVRSYPWAKGGENQFLADVDVGMMPLADGPFERGKCGYKLIQYLASRVPVIASPVGVNAEIVQNGWGTLAKTEQDWLDAMRTMAQKKANGLLLDMGMNGRHRVENRYCIQSTAEQLWSVLSRASERK
jgi:glycosyltransferase involved in cell wall biosynthesis